MLLSHLIDIRVDTSSCCKDMGY